MSNTAQITEKTFSYENVGFEILLFWKFSEWILK